MDPSAGTATITNSTFDNNTAAPRGGHPDGVTVTVDFNVSGNANGVGNNGR
jgi:hypothetical protein